MTRAAPPPRGTILLMDLAPVVGHEQHGIRPCLVVSDPVAMPHQRFPLLVIVPLTGAALGGALYPVLQPTPENGLTKPSAALVDHVRSLDPRRLRARLGKVSVADLARVDDALRLLLAL